MCLSKMYEVRVVRSYKFSKGFDDGEKKQLLGKLSFLLPGLILVKDMDLELLGAAFSPKH